jgi:hypothetical protein
VSVETSKSRDDDKDREKGAEGGDSDAKDRAPGAPASDDDSPLGDTDQHSSADA